MGEMQENFLNSDPDATLVQPRFDEAEAQTAQPVVPLTRARAWQSRRLPVALVLVSALLGGLVSVVAYRLYLRPAQTETAAQAQTKTEAQTAAPQEASPSPELAAAAPAKDETARAETPSPAESKPEERAPAAEPRAAKGEDGAAREEANGRRADERAAREASARKESPRTVREEPPPRARRVEVIPAYPEADRVGHDRHRDDDNDAATDYQLPPDRRDGRRGGRRARRRNIDRIRDIFGAPPPG
jgi:hypothetical protein